MLAYFALVVAAQVQQGDIRTVVQNGDTTAMVAAVRGQPADAREQLRQWISEAARGRPTADSVIQLARRLARAYATAWDDSFPVTNLERFLGFSPEQRLAKRSADSVRLAGNAASTREGMDAALRLWRSALRRSTRVPDTAGMAAALGNIGAGLYQTGELDSADAYLKRAADLAASVGDQRTLLNALGVSGAVAIDRGELRLADEILRRALRLRAPIGDVRGAAADHTNLGLIAAGLGDGASARQHYDEALALGRAHSLDDVAATALLNIANLLSQQSEYTDAERLYAEALALFAANDQDADVALVQHNRGLLSLHRGDYRVAKTHLTQALRTFERVGTVADLVQVRLDLSMVEIARGDLRAAGAQLRAAEQALATASPQDELRADLALAKADLALQMNTFAVAERQYAAAEAAYRRNGNSAGEAEALQGRALLLLERRQFAQGLELLESARRTQMANDDRRPAALTSLHIGYARQLAGDIAVARRELEAARDSLAAFGDAAGEAAAHVALGNLELQAGAPLAAEAAFRRATELLASHPVPDVAWQARAGLARALRARGALGAAVIELRRAIDQIERSAHSLSLAERRATYLADKWDVYAELALVELARGELDSSFASSERMRAREMVEVMSRARVATAGAPDSALATREQNLRLRIADLSRRLETEARGSFALRGPQLQTATSGVTREALSRAQDQYGQLLLELRDARGELSSPVTGTAPWREISARLAPQQAMLAYLVADSTTLVYVVTRDTLHLLDLRLDRESLAALVDFARGTLSKPSLSDAAWRTPLARLHRQLIEPVETSGLLAGVQQLVIVPHGELHYLPFAALIRAGARPAYLVERYELGYAPSATVWMQLGERATVRDNRVLAFAPRTEELPGSHREVEAIGALYGSDALVFTGRAATEGAFRLQASGYGVVHLATYGVLNQHNPLFSFVDFGAAADSVADGRLEVHEVLGLSLRARLVVLSACQTALASGALSDIPAGDDWVGLVRAFLVAGARNVIATLWAVEDNSTATMMTELHRQLRAGDSEAAALSAAQRHMLRNPRTSSPFYWAGFIIAGGSTNGGR